MLSLLQTPLHSLLCFGTLSDFITLKDLDKRVVVAAYWIQTPIDFASALYRYMTIREASLLNN